MGLGLAPSVKVLFALVSAGLGCACASDAGERPADPPPGASASATSDATRAPEVVATERGLVEEPMVSGEALFAKEPEAAFPRRARVLRYSTLRLGRGEAARVLRASDDERKAEHDDERVVIDTTASEVRILVPSYQLVVAGYVPVDTLALAVVDEVRATLESGQPPRRATITLEPGFTGPFGDARSGERPVRVAELDLSVRVPVKALGRVYQRRPAEPPAGSTEVTLAAGATLHDGPGGPTLARLAEGSIGYLVGDEEAGQRRVWLRSGALVLEAWVATRQASKGPGLGSFGLGGLGFAGGYGRSHGVALTLPKGSKVYESATGPWVGVLVGDAMVYEGRERADDRATFEMPVGAFGWPSLYTDGDVLRTARQEVTLRARRQKRASVSKASGPLGQERAQSAFEGVRADFVKCVEKTEASSGKPLSGAFDVRVERTDASTVTAKVLRGPSKAPELVACLEQALRDAAPPYDRGNAVKGTFAATLTLTKP